MWQRLSSIRGCEIGSTCPIVGSPSNILQIYVIASEKIASAGIEPRSPRTKNFTKRVLYLCTSRPRLIYFLSLLNYTWPGSIFFLIISIKFKHSLFERSKTMTLMSIKRSKKSILIKKVELNRKSWYKLIFWSLLDLFQLNSNFLMIFVANLIDFVAMSKNLASNSDWKSWIKVDLITI